MNIRLFIIIFIIILILFLVFRLISNFKQFYKQFYYDNILNYMTKNSLYENKYFIDNFEKIISPFYEGEINFKNTFNKNINIRNKNEYTILHKSYTKNILNDLKNTNNHNTILTNLLKKILKNININGKKINYEDCMILDVLNSQGGYFPFFHTDIEWSAFNNNEGFQIWILLEDDEKIKPNGKMFILETDMVEPAKKLHIKKNSVIIKDNDIKLFNNNKTFKSLHCIKPKIKYLNANIGEIFIMSKNLFHISDPRHIKSNRRAINFRVVIKNNKKDEFKINNDITLFTLLTKFRKQVSINSLS